MLNLIRQLFNFIWRGWLYIFGTLAGFGGFIFNLNTDMAWYFKLGFLGMGAVSLFLTYSSWIGRDQDVADD